MGSDDDNQSPCPHVAKDMTMSYNCELFVNVVMGESKNSVAYRTIKDLIDNVKRRKLEKYLYKNPEERENKYLKILIGGAWYRSRYLSHAKRALYHLSYAPLII